MAAPEAEHTIQLTLGHLLAVVGFLLSTISLLIGVLWSLLLERVKKMETRLDQGVDEFTSIKVVAAGMEQAARDFDRDLTEQERVSSTYREVTDRKMSEQDRKITEIDTRCKERGKLSKS